MIRETAGERLARLTDFRDARAFYDDLAVREPMRPCEACDGVPQYHQPGACCGACHGLGRVRLTEDEVRAAYRAERASTGLPGAAFDGLARVELAGEDDPSPGHWLAAARRVARRLAAR